MTVVLLGVLSWVIRGRLRVHDMKARGSGGASIKLRISGLGFRVSGV